MLWRDPLYLWILLPAVLVLGAFLVARLRRRAALLSRFAETPLLPRLAPDADARRLRRRTVIRLAALALLVIGLAGPKWGFHWQEVHREGIDLIVALDTSRSMLATDVKPNRLERAKFAVMDLVPLLQGDRIGLVAFAGTAFLECPLTLDYAAFETSLRAIEVGIIPRGGTSLARALETGLDAFEARQGKYEAIILITDGENTEGDVKAAAQRAADLGVKVFTVGIGTAEGDLLPLGKDGFVKDRSGQVVKSRLNEDTLKDIALTTGGAYVEGLGPSLGLDQVFREHIATMERREVASTLERRYEERFQIPLALALLLLAVEALVPVRRVAGGRRRAWARPLARRGATAALLMLYLPMLVGFFDPPGDRAAEGNTLYKNGKYEEAASKYGEGLIDAPASALLQFNLATALYKQGKYDESIAALNKVAASGDAQWVAAANYNLGNAHYRVGENAESSDPQAAIAAYEEALACYKRSMVADAVDTDAKFNHEYVTRKLDELKKRLEEQKKQQEEQQEQQKQQQEQQQQDQAQDQQDQQQQQDEQQQQADEQQQQQDQQQQAGDEQQQQDQQQQQAEQPQGGEEQQQEAQQPEQQPGGAGEEPPQQQAEQQPQPGGASDVVSGEEAETQDQKTAHAVLDTARQEELDPQDIERPVGVAGVGEPMQDW